jgi:hypothetical protein
MREEEAHRIKNWKDVDGIGHSLIYCTIILSDWTEEIHNNPHS